MSRNASDRAVDEDVFCLGCGGLLNAVQWNFDPCPGDLDNGDHQAAPDTMTADELVAVMRDLGITSARLDRLGRPLGTLPDGRHVTIGRRRLPWGRRMFVALPPARALAEIARRMPDSTGSEP